MKTLGAAVSISIVLLFLQLEVATLISTPHIRSMANQIIRFNTTNNVSENSVSGVIAHMCFFSAYGCSLEKAMAPHSSTLAWGIPCMKEPGGLPSMGLHRVRHD